MTSGNLDLDDGTPRGPSGRHYVRGVLVSIVLGPLMVLCGINALLALVSQFVAGWTPSSWFSSNALDWIVAGGTEGGAAAYVVFMINGVLSSLCWAGIKWAFAERTDRDR